MFLYLWSVLSHLNNTANMAWTCKCCTPRRRIWTLPYGTVLRQYRTVFTPIFMKLVITQEGNKNVKGIASTAPIIAKGIIPQPHYVEISYIKFYPSSSKNVDSVCRNCFTHVSKAWLSLHGLSRTFRYAVAFRIDFLYQLLHKSVNNLVVICV